MMIFNNNQMYLSKNSDLVCSFNTFSNSPPHEFPHREVS